MHTLKKLVGQGGSSSSSASAGHKPDSDLGLSLLRSLVQSVLSKSSDLSAQEKRSKIKEILPLVLKLFRNSTGTEICAQFDLVAQFAGLICRLFVEEIRARARPSSTVYASRAIMDFLSGQEQQGSSSSQNASSASASSGADFGRNLLLCLEVVCSASKQVCDELVNNCLPSTLVKCVYIFYDLPPTANANEFNQRVGVKESVRNVLSQLLRYNRAAEELTNGDDLALLVLAVVNFCAPHNLIWRETASCALTTLSVNSLSPNIINYMHRKEVISGCIGKMREIGQFSPLEKVEMFVTLFCLLKDSASLSFKLLHDFETHKGYEFLKDFLLKMDQSECEANIDATIRTLALSVLSLVYCGESELKPPSDMEIQFSLPDFSVPQPSNRGNSLRNIRAFDVLQQTFINCNTASLLRTILEVISTIYNADVSNFFILYNQKTLVAFAHVIPQKSPEVWAHYFDLLDFVATTLRFVPMLELITLSSHLETRCSLDFCRSTLQFMQTLCLFHPIYAKVLNHCDLLRVLTSTIVHFSNHQHEFGLQTRAGLDPATLPSLDADNLSYYHFVIQTLIMILKDNETNIAAFKSFGGAAIHHLITPESTRSAALLLVQTLLCSSIGEDDTCRLIQRLSTVEQTDIKLKVDLLRCLADSLTQHSVVRSRFRLSQGFIHVSSLIVGLTNSLSSPPLPPWDKEDSTPQVFQLIETVLLTITAALHNDPANIRYFNKEVKFEYLVNSVFLLGCFVKRRAMPNYHHLQDGDEYLNHNPTNYFLHEFQPKRDLSGFSPQIAAVLNIFSFFMKVAIDSFSTAPTRLEDNTPAIVHPGAIVAMLTLLPGISFPGSRQWECAVHFHILCVLQKLVLSCERNAQLLSRSGVIRVLIGPVGAVMLLDEHHPSHLVAHSLLDRISSQRIEVRDLRAYLRLGSPLHCMFNEADAVNQFVPTDDRWRLVSTMGLISSPSSSQAPSLMTQRSDNVFTSCTTDDLPPPDDSQVWGGNSASASSVPRCTCCICRIKLGNVPLNTIKTLVTLTNKREILLGDNAKCGQVDLMVDPPPFLEFNYKFEGYGCVFVPNLVPNSGSSMATSGTAAAVAALSSTASTLVASGTSPSAAAPPPASAGSGVVSLGPNDHRVFPPNNGMTFACWINLAELPEDCNHHVRLCTISRHFSSGRPDSTALSPSPAVTSVRSVANGSSPSLNSSFDFVEMSQQSKDVVCFQVGLSAVDHSLVVSTKEVAEGTRGFTALDDPTGGTSNYDLSVKSNLFKQTNQWMHIAVVLTKGFVKQSTCSVYVNGMLHTANRMHYVSAVSPSSSGPSPSSVLTNLTIGTSQLCATDRCALKWKMASAHLFEDTLSNSQIAHICKLGPSYSGSFQRCPLFTSNDMSSVSPISNFTPMTSLMNTPSSSNPLGTPSAAAPSGGVVSIVNEDKVIWGVNAGSLCALSLAKIRRLYGKNLALWLSKLLRLSLTDEVCPVRFLYNSASHLQGAVRAPLGGVLIGNSSVRCFSPSPLPSTLNKLGAPLIVLELIAKSDSVERLYACVKLLHCLLPCLDIQRDMPVHKWFHTLSLLLQKKAALINTHVAQIILETIAIYDANGSNPNSSPSTREGSRIDNQQVFYSESRLCVFYKQLALSEVLLNLDIWSSCTSEVQLLIYQSLTSAASDNNIAEVMVATGVIPKIIAKLRETLTSGSVATSNALMQLAVSLLTRAPHTHIACLAQYICSLLHLPNLSQSEHSFPENSVEYKTVTLRNHALYCLIREAFSLDGANKLNTEFCLLVQEAIGFDWLLLFLCDPRIHESTVVAAFRLLTIILLSPTGMSNFKSGVYNGNWLSITNSTLQQQPYSNKSLAHFEPQSAAHLGVTRQQSLAAIGLNANNPTSVSSTQNTAEAVAAQRATAAETRSTSVDVITSQGVSLYGTGGVCKFRPALCVVNGFDALQFCMANHTHVTQLYYLLFALTLSKIPIRDPPKPHVQFSGQELCAYADFRYPHNPAHSPLRGGQGSAQQLAPPSSSANILIEPLQVIIVMLQHAIHKLSVEERSRRESDPPDPDVIGRGAGDVGGTGTNTWSITNIIDSLLQLLQSLNHASVTHFFTAPVLNCITAVLFPPNISYTQCGNQRVKQSLLDLLTGIVIQSMMYPLPQKSLPVFDIILDSCPVFSDSIDVSHSSSSSTTSMTSPVCDRTLRRSKMEKKQFTTDMTHSVMDYILKGEMMNPSAAALPFTPGGNPQHIPSHLVYLSNRIVDLVWQQMLNKSASEVIEFLCRLIQQADTASSSSSSGSTVAPVVVDSGIFSALNRVLILDLTQVPNEQLLGQMGTLECFRKYVGKRKYIFASGNCDVAFLGALCCKIFNAVHSSKNATNREFVVTGCQRLWDTIIERKREQIENIFRVNLPAISSRVDVCTFSDKFREASQKYWNNFLKEETERAQQDPFTLYSQLNQSKISRWGGTLTKGIQSLTSKGSTKQSSSSGTKTGSSNSGGVGKVVPVDVAVHHWVNSHSVLALENISAVQTHLDQLKANCVEATPTEHILSNSSTLLKQRGLWGPLHASRYDKWMLDMTEGPCRMRKRMKPHHNFYSLFPYRHEQEENRMSTRKRAPSSEDSKYFYAKHGLLLKRTNSVPASSASLSTSEKHLLKNNTIDVPNTSFSSARTDVDSKCISGHQSRLKEQLSKDKVREQIEEEEDDIDIENENVSFDLEEGNESAMDSSQQDELDLQASIKEMQLTSSSRASRRLSSEAATDLEGSMGVASVEGVAITGEEHTVSDTGESASDQHQHPTSVNTCNQERGRDSEPGVFNGAPTTDTTTAADSGGANSADNGGNSRERSCSSSYRKESRNAPRTKTLSSSSSTGGAGPNRMDSSSSLVEMNLTDSATQNSSAPSLFAVLGVSEAAGGANCTMCRCARIQGLDNFEGLMVFFRECFFIVDGYTMFNGEVRDIDCLSSGEFEPIIPKTGQQQRVSTSSEVKTGRCSSSSAGRSPHSVMKLNYDEMREVHKRRYLLQPIALELFSADGRSLLLAFPVSHGYQSDRNKAYHKLLTFCPSLTTSAAQSVSGQKASTSVEGSSGIISSLIGEKSVTQRWERGEISNFQYLMHLNTLAGRSYNDLMQYPVFPWILKDYESEVLDLENPKSFRDLSKPMGAQCPSRLESFLKRFKEWESDQHFDTPPYHYGTHYSSAMIVCSFLVRLEPFTSSFLRLQGGHFDLADRMFHSIKDTWLSASQNNMADVKELIPEFFYLPQFLRNENKFDLGRKQNGTVLNDVILPKWAKGCPDEFIRMHREALESDFVSAHLHEWIDLIFGFKQRGPAAREAYNLFHHLFYEGNVDIYNISDPLKKNAVIGFINNFGQIPEQLFKKPHPTRKAFLAWSVERPFSTVYPAAKIFYHQPDNLQPSFQLVKAPHKSPVGQIRVGGNAQDKVLSVEQNMLLIPNQNGKFLAWGFIDGSIRMGATADSEKLTTICEGVTDISVATMPNEKILFTGGSTGVITVWGFNAAPVDESKTYLRVNKQLYGHHGAVTCLSGSSNFHVVVSGSRDCSCIVWDVNREEMVRQLPHHFHPISQCHINNTSGDIITTAGWYLYVWTINCEPIAFINTAVTSQQQQHISSATTTSFLLASSASCSSSALSSGGGISCLSASELNEWSTDNVILTGGNDGVVRMWSIEMCQVPCNNTSSSAGESCFLSPSENNNNININVTSSAASQPTRSRPEQLSSEAFAKRYSIDSLEEDTFDGDTQPLFEEEEAMGVAASAVGDGDSALHQSRSRAVEGAEGSENEADSVDNANVDHSLSLSRTLEHNPTNRIQFLSTSTQRHSSGSTYQQDVGGDSVTPDTPGSYISPSSGEIESEGNISVRRQPPEFPTSSSNQTAAVSVNMNDSFHIVSQTDLTNIPESVAPLDLLDGTRQRSGCFVSEPEAVVPVGGLRPGFKWQHQIVFRTKLTAHTAFERQDNQYPAAITAIAIHPDHSRVYVGDSRGRVLQWVVCESAPGKAPVDNWMRDEGSSHCMHCATPFSFTERRHHCRNCGKLFCAKCSNYQTTIPQKRISTNVRVCQTCFTMLTSNSIESV